jgi:hypothetical protein
MNTENKTMANITEQSKALFIALAKDSRNWNGTPLLDVRSNVNPSGRVSKEQRVDIAQLKRVGLITTFVSGNGCTWVDFTEAGHAFAEECGVQVTDPLQR